jgi:hypothetical protein
MKAPARKSAGALSFMFGWLTQNGPQISFAGPCGSSFQTLSQFFRSSSFSRTSWRSLIRSWKKPSYPCLRQSSNLPCHRSCIAHLWRSMISHSCRRSKTSFVCHLCSALCSARSFGHPLQSPFSRNRHISLFRLERWSLPGSSLRFGPR